MKYEKQKKIRTKLINYTNQQLKTQKHKKTQILINSTPLEELEKKNMRCKEFFIEEKTQIYQNIDHRRSIVQNIYIHSNSFCSNIVIFPLSSRIIINDIIKKKENRYRYNSNLNLNYMDIGSSNSLIRIDNLSSTSQHKNIESPVDQSCLYKKELGERKFKKKSKNEVNSNVYNSLGDDKCDKNNEKDNIKKNESEKRIVCSKQLSTETVATDISRIIKVCHNDKNVNSFELSRCDSKIEETEEIKKARKYAKKLKYYCRTLKNKYPKRDKKRIKKIENKIYNNNNKAQEKPNFEKRDKKSFHKSKNDKKPIIFNDKEKKTDKKKHSEKKKGKDFISIDTENNVKNTQINKKMKSERNIKAKIKRDSFVNSEDNYNNITEQSTINQAQNKTLDVDSNTKNRMNNSNFIKIGRKKTKKFNENENKIKIKKPKDKKEITQNKKIRNKLLEISSNIEITEKIENKKKKKSIIEDNNKKEEESPLNELRNPRNSIDTRMIGSNNSGLECLFIDTKKLSITEGISVFKKKKKKPSGLNHTFNNNNNNVINEKGKENISPIKKKLRPRKTKINLTQKENNEEKIEIKKIKKTKTVILKKSKKNKNKRKTSNISSDEKNDTEIITTDNTLKQNNNMHNSKKTNLQYDESFISVKKDNYHTNETKEDFNMLDEYLYQKKHKRTKNQK